MKLPDFGTAWSCVKDLTMPALMVSGFRVVAEAVARRWLTARGTLIDDPNYGFDLTDAISDDLDLAGISRLQQAAAAEARKDQRVLACACSITLTTGVLTIAAKITTAQGPFSLVLAVSQVSPPTLQVAA